MSHEAIARILRQSAGLDDHALGRGVLDRAVERRQRELGIRTDAEYAARVESSREELQRLVDEVVVPETSFFRDPAAFSALSDWAAREWLPSHPGARLNILSIPCSTGEEPCSIAMTLLDLPYQLRFHVDGVDISTRAIEIARRGEYGSGSFRGRHLSYRDRWFEPSTRGYRIRNEVLEHIDYHHGNLLGDTVPERLYDVVFCRNLLIYFDAASQQLGMQKLASLLMPGGLLFLGPAETFLATRNAFRSLAMPMTFGFVRADAALPPAPVARRQPRTRPTPAPQFVAAKPKRSARTAPPAPAREPAGPIDDRLQRAEALADAGRLEEAQNLCRAWIAANGASAPALFLMGVVSDALGRSADAISWFRKVLYLEPAHEQALLHLSVLARKEGVSGRAAHLDRRARGAGDETRREGTA